MLLSYVRHETLSDETIQRKRVETRTIGPYSVTRTLCPAGEYFASSHDHLRNADIVKRYEFQISSLAIRVSDDV